MSGSGWSHKRVAREARRTVTRFRNPGPLELSRTVLRAFKLHGRHLAPPIVQVARQERVVITLTTIPARLKMLAPALRSLLDQTVRADRILLALPYKSLRTGEIYPDPSTLGLPAGLDVIRCGDQGPATKILPALKLEPDALLVVVDDDVIYPRRFLEVLLRAHRRSPGAALGLRGVKLARDLPFSELEHIFSTGVARDIAVDVLFGTWGYLIPPGTLGVGDYEFGSAPRQARWADDIWISGHLARAGVPRIVFPSDQLPIETAASWRAALTNGINRSGENDRITAELFAADW